MGACCSTNDQAPDSYTDKDASSKRTNSHAPEVFRFFMVGMGSAGKSTVIKQLQKLCHDRPEVYQMFDAEWNPINHRFQSHEMERYERLIRRNIFDALAVLEHYACEWELRPADSSTKASRVVEDAAGDIHSFAANHVVIDQDVAQALIQLISEGPIQAALKRRADMLGELQIADGTLHFLKEEKMKEVFSAGYSPSYDDIVHSRAPTTGIHDYRFGIRSMRIQIHDIGGQRVERGKLLTFINNWVSADRSGYRNFILYVVSMAEYNVLHPQHPNITLLDESIMMLQNILELQPIQNCGLMIFFNKEDVFREKIGRLDSADAAVVDDALRVLGPHMKEAKRKEGEHPDSLLLQSERKHLRKGGEAAFEAARNAVASKLTEAIRLVQTKRYKGIYHKFTCAVDTKLMGSLFNAIENELINFSIDTASFLFP